MKSILTCILMTFLVVSVASAAGRIDCPAGAHHPEGKRAPSLDPESTEKAPSPDDLWFEAMRAPRHPAPNPRPDLRPATPTGDWGPMIDAVWGPGFGGAEQYTLFWDWITTLENEYAAFNNYDIGLYSIYAPFITEVQAGVSRGRFHAIMNSPGRNLHNAHVNFLDLDVWRTQPAVGVPLLVGSRYSQTDPFHSGACLTTDEAGEVFVYDVVADHPLGLEVGDVILGYDGVSWSDLYPQLLAAELPITGTWLTAEESYIYSWRTAVAENWHLFDTMDVRKYGTGEVQHLATSLMVDSGVEFSIHCSDMINDDLPRPVYPDWLTWDILEFPVSTLSKSGVIDTLRIGFIRSDAWFDNSNQVWHDACLAAVGDTTLHGLIVDFRNNQGGNVAQADAGFAHLFDKVLRTINFGYRNDPINHMTMTEGNWTLDFAVKGEPADYFDKPIAMLTGPKTISAGDFNALRLDYHPMVRSFGRPTSGTFDSPIYPTVEGHPELWYRYSFWNSFQVNEPGTWLSHWGMPVDEEVWLTPEASRLRVDPVIERAKDWIYRLVSPVAEIPILAGSRIISASPNPFNPHTRISFHVDRAGPCRVDIYDLAGRALKSRRWERLGVGPHEFVWDGTLDSGRAAASGAYLVRLTAPDGDDVARVSLVK